MKLRFVLIGLLLVLFSTQVYASLTDDLVAYYKLDEKSGTTAVDSIGNNNGIINGATLNQSGKIRTSFLFDGSNDQVNLGTTNSFSGNVSRTYNVWFKVSSKPGTNVVLIGQSDSTCSNTHFDLQLNGTGLYFHGCGIGNDFSGEITYSVDTWYMASVTHDSSTNVTKLWFNGSEVGTQTNSRNTSGSATTYLAYEPRDNTYYAGNLDEVGVWNRALTETEITELYNSGFGLTYPFDVNAITADFDYSINNLQVDLNDTSRVDGNAVIDSWEWLIDDVSVSTDQNYSFTGTEATDYNVCLIVQDTTLSLEDSDCQTISIGDLTPPTTTFSSSQIAGTTDQNITLTCTDNNSGCKTINYNINNEGWNLFNVTKTDTNTITKQNNTTTAILSNTLLVNGYVADANFSFREIGTSGTANGFVQFIYFDGTDFNTAEQTVNETNFVLKTFTNTSPTKIVSRINTYIRSSTNGQNKEGGTLTYSTTPQTNYSFLYSGVGQHSIQYFSTDNSDNNETIKTSYFTTYGAGKFTFYDENSLNLLNSINYTITPSINGVSSGTTSGNTLDLILQGITTGTYTFTFTKSGYPTRYYQIDLNQYSEIDINFALIPESLSKEIQFRFYKPDQTTSYNNVYITASKNPQGFVLSRLKTDATGLVTLQLDQNSTGITFDMNNGENTYNSVVLTINKPKDEQTLIDINANWSYEISGLASYTDSNATTATKVFAIYSNTVNTYSVLIGSKSTVPPYTTRKYDIQVFGDTNTYTLQPYLINTTDSIQTTIFTINPYTNQTISDVTIKIYRTLPLTGRTLIEQTITDSKGQSIVYLVLNQTYSFEISVGTTTIRTETYTITGTSSTIYFKVDPGYDLSTTPMQTSIYSFWTPGKNSLNKADRNISANVIYGTNKNSVTVSSIILNCYNNLDLNQVLLFQDSFSSPTMNFIQTYDFNLTTKTLNSVTFDTNYSITCNIYTTLSDGNLIVSRQTYTMNNDDPQTNLGMDLRPFFGCSPTTDPNLPCPSMILAAVFITMMVITGIMIESGFTQPEFAGILFLIGLGFFTFFTWIPPVLYVIMLVIGLLIYVALGVRRI